MTDHVGDTAAMGMLEPAGNEPEALVGFLTMKWDLQRRRLADLQRRYEVIETHRDQLESRRDHLESHQEYLEAVISRIEAARAVGIWREDWKRRRGFRDRLRRRLPLKEPLISRNELNDAVETLTLLDPTDYASRVGDLNSLSPREHYLRYGYDSEISPGKAFRPDDYLRENPDVVEMGINALAHYLCFGYREARKGVGAIRLRGDADRELT